MLKSSQRGSHLLSRKTYLAEIDVSIFSEGMKRGETKRMICPKCGGGTTKERSFSISKDDKGRVLYLCFRAKCGYRGGLLGVVSVQDDESPKQQKSKEFYHEVSELTEEQKGYFGKMYDIRDTSNIFWIPTLKAYGHRVYGPTSKFRGWMCRSYEGERRDLAFPAVSAEPFMHWNIPRFGAGGVVVVEDMLSGYKVAEAGFTSCVLLGTSLGYERAYEIAEYTEGGVNLALDKGTMELMLRYRKMFEPIWKDVRIWSLDKDLKYVDTIRIRKAMMDGAINFATSV